MRGARVAEPRGLTEQMDVAGVGSDETAEDFDECGLAGAVLAEQRMNVARPDGERHVIQGNRGAEVLS